MLHGQVLNTWPPDLRVNSPANCLDTSLVPVSAQLDTYPPCGRSVLYQETPTPVSFMLCTAAPRITIQAITLPLMLHREVLGSLPQLNTSSPCGRSVLCQDTDSTFLHALQIRTHMNFQINTLLLLPHAGVGHAVQMAVVGQTPPLSAESHALIQICHSFKVARGDALGFCASKGTETSSWHRN